MVESAGARGEPCLWLAVLLFESKVKRQAKPRRLKCSVTRFKRGE